MAYVAVKGGEAAISAAHSWLAEMRRGAREVPALELAQIKEQLGRAVDRRCLGRPVRGLDPG